MAPLLARFVLRRASRTGAAGLLHATLVTQRPTHLALRALIPQFASYATATKKATPVKKTTAAKITAAKTTASKTKTKTAPAKKKKPAAKKAAPKKAAPKKKKAVAKKTVKKRTKKELSPEKQITEKAKEMRKAALPEAPLPRSGNQYAIYVQNTLTGKQGFLAGGLKEVAQGYKDLSEAEKTALREQAVKQNAERKREYMAFIEKHTPEEIAKANTARRWLIKHDKAYKKTSHLLKDHRLPKKPNSAFALYVQAERSSKGLSMQDIATQWNTLPSDDKKAFLELEAAGRKAYTVQKEQIQKLNA